MRCTLRSTVLICLAAPALFAAGFQSEAAPVEMLRGYLTGVANRQLADRREKIAAIRTRGDAERRQTEVRRAVLQMMGGLPGAKTPLNLRTTGTIERDDYRVDKIVLDRKSVV